MTITRIDNSKPGAPTDLTEETASKPVAPSNLTEQAESKPVAPANLTEQAKNDPAAPVTLTGIAASEPLAPLNLSELSKVDPAAPANLTEIAKSEPLAPTNLSELALSNPVAPVNLTEIARPGINRTLSPLFNFNAALGLPDTVTYSRSSSASYIETFKGPLGRFQKRLANDFIGTFTNFALYSQDFENADWSKLNTTVKSNAIENPIDGSRTADEITNTNGANDRVWKNDVLVGVGVTFSWSVMVKNINTAEFSVSARPSTGTLQRAIFDFKSEPNSDPIISVDSGVPIPFKKYMGNGWFEVGITITSTTSSYDFEFDINRVGTVGSKVYLFGAVLTSTAKPISKYIRTFDSSASETFNSIPRFEEKGLLVEGASTNLATRSEEFNDNTAWTKVFLGVNANTALALDGSFSADKIFEDATTNQHRVIKAINFTAGLTYTYSVYAKAGERNQIDILFPNTAFIGVSDLRQGFTLIGDGSVVTRSGGADSTGKIENVGNGWYRCSITATADVTVSAAAIIYLIKDDAISYAGDNVSGLFLWGAQVEALPFATSYIRTEGSAVSRGAESLGSSVYVESEYTVLTEGSSIGATTSGTQTLMSVGSASTARVSIVVNGITSFLRYFVQNTVLQFDRTTSAPVEGVKTKGAIVFENGVGIIYVDDILNFTSSSIAVPNITRIDIGALNVGREPLYGHINRIEIYDLALTANEVKAL